MLKWLKKCMSKNQTEIMHSAKMIEYYAAYIHNLDDPESMRICREHLAKLTQKFNEYSAYRNTLTQMEKKR